MSLPEMMLLLTFTGVPIGSKPGGTSPTGQTPTYVEINMLTFMGNILILAYILVTIPGSSKLKSREPLIF